MRHVFSSTEVKDLWKKRKEQRQKRLLEISSQSNISKENVLDQLEKIFVEDDESLPLLIGNKK